MKTMAPADPEEPDDDNEPEEHYSTTPSRQTLRAAVADYAAGFDFEWIAERHGYPNPRVAQEEIERFLGSTLSPTSVETARQRSLQRRETLLKSLWVDANSPWVRDEEGRPTKKRNDQHLPYLREARLMLDAIDKLLGTNAPVQVEVYRPEAEELNHTIAGLKAILRGDTPSEGDIFAEVDPEPEDE